MIASAQGQPHVGRARAWGLVLLGLSCLALLGGLALGSTGLAWPFDAQAQQHLIVWDIRLPRSLGAWLSGALLGMSGALAQGLFRNPLADPYLLGSASGASLGVAVFLAALGISPAVNDQLLRWGLTGAAFLGATGAVFLTLVLANGVQHTLRLLLAGVIVGVVFGSLASLIMMLVPEVMQAQQAFLLGSTGFVGWNAVHIMAWVYGCSALVLVSLSRVLDALTLGEQAARSLGFCLAPLRAILIVVLALTVGTAVAQTGLIAFVGLVAPHLVRAALRTNHAALVLLSSFMGGLLLLLADVLARWLIAPTELPVGVLTALLGGAYLLFLMHRQNARHVGVS